MVPFSNTDRAKVGNENTPALDDIDNGPSASPHLPRGLAGSAVAQHSAQGLRA